MPQIPAGLNARRIRNCWTPAQLLPAPAVMECHSSVATAIGMDLKEPPGTIDVLAAAGMAEMADQVCVQLSIATSCASNVINDIRSSWQAGKINLEKHCQRRGFPDPP